jgi:hypothetical protein
MVVLIARIRERWAAGDQGEVEGLRKQPPWFEKARRIGRRRLRACRDCDPTRWWGGAYGKMGLAMGICVWCWCVAVVGEEAETLTW